MKKLTAAIFAAALALSACGSSSDDASDELTEEGLALATAITDAQMADGDNPFTREEVQCTNEGYVRSVGFDTMTSYGVTVDNPDDSQLPQEFEIQQKGLKAITDCVNIGETFRALAPPGCEIPLSDDEMELAMTHDFLSDFPEYDDPDAAKASADMQAAIAACG